MAEWGWGVGEEGGRGRRWRKLAYPSFQFFFLLLLFRSNFFFSLPVWENFLLLLFFFLANKRTIYVQIEERERTDTSVKVSQTKLRRLCAAYVQDVPEKKIRHMAQIAPSIRASGTVEGSKISDEIK